MKTKLVLLTIAAIAMWALKRYYADAPVDDLRWILGPTARLVTASTGVRFEWDAGQGYLSRERLFVIEKACAGINFMIAAFGMIVWALAERGRSWRPAAAVLLTAVAAGYSAAVIVNAVRIAVAMRLASHPIGIDWMTAAQVHRVEGVVCYFSGLVLLYELVRRVDSRAAAARVRP